jgi:hypothetical protein
MRSRVGLEQGREFLGTRLYPAVGMNHDGFLRLAPGHGLTQGGGQIRGHQIPEGIVRDPVREAVLMEIINGMVYLVNFVTDPFGSSMTLYCFGLSQSG